MSQPQVHSCMLAFWWWGWDFVTYRPFSLAGFMLGRKRAQGEDWKKEVWRYFTIWNIKNYILVKKRLQNQRRNRWQSIEKSEKMKTKYNMWIWAIAVGAFRESCWGRMIGAETGLERIYKWVQRMETQGMCAHCFWAQVGLQY